MNDTPVDGERLPDFIIIGAMKCGTTSLYAYLDGHPNIAMSRVKEPKRKVQSVLFVGRLVPKKAPLDAVQGLKRANEWGAGLSLNFVGEGPLREELEQYVCENDLSDQVTVHGQLPNEEVATRMQAADALLLPSKTAPDGDREGTPTVLVEAQAIGFPCITTWHSGIPEMIPEDNQKFLVPEGDVEGIAEKLVYLSTLSIEELVQIARLGRQKVSQEFDLTGEAASLVDLYVELCEGTTVSGRKESLLSNEARDL
jgi:colanic acid/amylovoran biosynthesis glycosyltransferase